MPIFIKISNYDERLPANQICNRSCRRLQVKFTSKMTGRVFFRQFFSFRIVVSPSYSLLLINTHKTTLLEVSMRSWQRHRVPFAVILAFWIFCMWVNGWTKRTEREIRGIQAKTEPVVYNNLVDLFSARGDPFYRLLVS